MPARESEKFQVPPACLPHWLVTDRGGDQGDPCVMEELQGQKQ